LQENLEYIDITTEFIPVDAFLKFSARVSSGGEAKALIQQGLVTVNGETCTQRKRKLRDGDRVALDGVQVVVRGVSEGQNEG
jgi:ribosome-associated protein